LRDVNAKALWFVLCLRKLGEELHDFSRTLVEVLVDFAKVTDFLYVSILSHIESQTVKKDEICALLFKLLENRPCVF
jgi:hypothetical protein